MRHPTLRQIKKMMARERQIYNAWSNKDHMHAESSPLLGGKAYKLADEEEEDTAPVPFLKSRKFGVILITLSALSYGLSASIVSMEKDIATPLVVGARFLGAFVCTAIGCAINRVNLLALNRASVKVLIFRSIFGFISFVCGTYAFQNMPVGEATVIVSMAPVFVALLSTCFLGESLSCTTTLLILLSMSGVVMIVDPDAIASSTTLPRLNIIAAVAAIAQAFSKAVSYIFIKRSNNRIYFLTMIFWYALFGTLVSLLFIVVAYFSLKSAGKDTSWVVNNVDTKDYLCLFAISILGFISQLTLTKATQMINTTIVSLVRNTDILVTMMFQIFYFHIVPCWLQIIGMVVMVIATLCILLTKERERVITQHPRCFPRCD